MSLFEPVELTWKGAKYTIPANRVLRAIAKVEEVVTLHHLSANPDNIPVARIAMAYGALLRFAGAPADDDDVYEVMMSGGTENGAPVQMVQALLFLMLPKKVRDKLEAQVQPEQSEPVSEGNGSAATTEAG